MPTKSAVLPTFAALAVAFVAIFIALSMRPAQYIFTAEEMSRFAKNAIREGKEHGGLNTTVHSVVRQLRERYGDYIIDNPPWIFNNAGGAMGSMLVLHCSLLEYVIIFGSALGTEGHTGRFLADDYFTILHGEQWAYRAGALEKEIYRPGDQHFLPRGVAKQYKMPDSAWALEYARGNILSMLPFGVADSLTSTMDFVTIWQTVKVSVRGMVKEFFRRRV